MPTETDNEFVEYVSARMARLHRAAYFMCGDAHRADDLVQATLVSLYARWKHARSADNLDGYVHRILIRRYVDERRSAWSRVLLRDRFADVPDESGTSFAEHDSIVSALRQLPAGQRAVIVLRYFSDLSVEQTAQAMSCSTGNVKSQCSRGLAALRNALATDASAELTETTTLTTKPTGALPQRMMRAATQAHGS
jgi:RNA polymerase sigma-70 factor (sigma-E family)